MKKGNIILIEGTDKSGKETQTTKLVNRLRRNGHGCERMGFPRYDTPTGRIIGQCYLGKEDLGEGDVAWFGDADSVNPKIACGYYALDRLAAVPDMMSVINAGRHLILDRYVESNMAHQGGKAKKTGYRKKIINDIAELEYKHYGLPMPDEVVFLYMPWEVGRELGKNSGEKPDGHESNIEHLKRAEETYLWLAKRRSWKKIDCAPDRTLDSLRDPDDIHEELYDFVFEKINK
ncbi:hypothetical protein GF378_03050 [Candidatus Pacearchaeota archaeon]|nr:hypothetical protein [Candidatus Pacearchaeota archaeon]